MTDAKYASLSFGRKKKVFCKNEYFIYPSTCLHFPGDDERQKQPKQVKGEDIGKKISWVHIFSKIIHNRSKPDQKTLYEDFI